MRAIAAAFAIGASLCWVVPSLAASPEAPPFLLAALSVKELYDGLVADIQASSENSGGSAQGSADPKQQEADQYWEKAQELQKQGKYQDAAVMYEKSAEAEKASSQPRWAALAVALGEVGYRYYLLGQYDKALEYYKQALAIRKKLGQEAGMTTMLNNIGLVYDSWGQYDKALEYFQQALAIAKKLGQEAQMAPVFNNIGGVYRAWGQYDKALEYFQQALAIDKKLGREAGMTTMLNNIGEVYRAWGQYDKALEYYQQALAINKKLGQEADMAVVFNNIGHVYNSLGQYDKALEYVQQALVIDKKLGREAKIATMLNNIGEVYRAWGQYDKALEYYQQALDIDKKLGQEAQMAYVLNNIGVLYYAQAHYSQAIPYLENAIVLKEKIRKTAIGEVRRDYLASQMYTYQSLISATIRDSQSTQTYQALENSKAKVLAESLAGSDNVVISSLEAVQSQLSPEQIIVSYGNSDGQKLAQLVLTNKTIQGQEISTTTNLKSLLEKYQPQIQSYIKDKRGVQLENESEQILQVKEDGQLAGLVSYYRSLLTHPSADNNAETQEIARQLYALLIKPMSESLKGKKELLIVPDGILAFLPFETLIDENGKYLIETYDIRYTQSLAVLEQLKNRNYPSSRKPLLAFGGAVYDEVKYAAEMVQNDQQLAYLKKQVHEGRGSGESYAALGIRGWKNLPGTLAEVQSIQQLVTGTDIVMGDKVKEDSLKDLSTKGELAKYKVLHFATHGLVVPEIPELSALVLSQLKQPQQEDGYLQMQEIANLKLQADFVNLSACETGLGKLYGGEGVVGLTQAFLLAGANGLSVSLWQVADESTAQFMVAMYAKVEQEKFGYSQAINEMKRKFIQGDFGPEYRHPYYWAPFVYYGK